MREDEGEGQGEGGDVPLVTTVMVEGLCFRGVLFRYSKLSLCRREVGRVAE